jgi:hypothetical protein
MRKVQMSEAENRAQQEIVVSVAAQIADDQLVPVQSWLRSLLDIAKSDAGRIQKLRSFYRATLDSKILWPIIKMMAAKLKTVGWTNQSPRMKWIIAGAVSSAIFFPGASAGIAALGGAIGVPLWIVFGAGAGFAQALYNEIGHRLTKNK